MAKVHPFAKLYFANYFYFSNSPNINPAKHSHCMLHTLTVLASFTVHNYYVLQVSILEI